MCRIRRRGSLRRHRSTSLARSCGTSAGSGGGSSLVTAASVDTVEPPWKGRCPRSISWMSAPKLNTSERGAHVNGPALGLLGRHVAGRPRDPAVPRLRGRLGRPPVRHVLRGHGGGVHQLRQAEVQHPRAAVVADHDVCGLEIAVDDPGFVGCFQHARDLDRDPQRLAERQAPAGDQPVKRLADDQLHHDVVAVVLPQDVVYRDDVRASERGSGVRPLAQPGPALGIAGRARGQGLQRDEPVELRVARLVDDAHAASAQRFERVARESLHSRSGPRRPCNAGSWNRP